MTGGRGGLRCGPASRKRFRSIVWHEKQVAEVAAF